MKKIFNVLLFSFVFVIFSLPVYGTGYEDISLTKIVFQLVFYLAMFVLVIILSLYGTRLIAKNYKGFGGSKYTTLIDVMNIQNGYKIQIVKINKKIYILLTSNGNSNVIDIIEEDDFSLELENFDNYLLKHLNKNNTSNKVHSKIKDLFNKSYTNKDKEDENDEEKY
ncbi:hypothetical protein [Tissierella sp.]|uniref:hypothetical protein n=1 Tax=Tissierella sp. TaxID=41274 RepID=UPI00286496CB|nr:hypothetical protein [Tissierella sp.]MDR7856257.1 hypothetical protein [Tissierella sp.]